MKLAEVLGFAAQKEFYRKTSHPNQMWATDGAYLKVAGWVTTTSSPSSTTTAASSWPGACNWT